MNVPRSEISSALFNLISGCYAWATAGPRMQIPANLGALAQPAFFLVKSEESVSQADVFGLPTYTLQYYAYILVRASATPEDPGSTAENVMDVILDAIDATMAPIIPGLLQTLGGLVTNCWISGKIQIDTPVLFQQCAIWIPITVLVGAGTDF